MKIYIEANKINTNSYETLIRLFKNITFVNDVENSYDCDAAIVFPSFVNESNLAKYPNLQWIQLLVAGFNTIDLEAVHKRDILLTNAKGVYSITIAEDVICKILTLNRNVKYYLHNMQEKIWKPIPHEPEIYGSTVGILGAGSIAKEIAKRAKAFEAVVIGYRRNPIMEQYFDDIYTGENGLEALLKQSDYLIIALPLNYGTYGLINKEKLALMKPNSVIINIARGEIIVQDDLIQALKDKRIRAAGLDVTSPEPLPKDSELWSLDNVYITPHNSVSSPHMAKRITNLLIQNIDRFYNHEDLVNFIVE